MLQAVGVWEEARETDALHAIDASLYDMAIGAYRKQGAFDKVGRPVFYRQINVNGSTFFSCSTLCCYTAHLLFSQYSCLNAAAKGSPGANPLIHPA